MSAMTLQLWLPLAIAIVGLVGTLASGFLSAHWTARNAERQAERQAERTRHDSDRKDLAEAHERFLAVTRTLRRGTGSADAALVELNAVVARIQRLRPDVADRVEAASTAVERLVEMRSEGMWSDPVERAESDFEQAIAALREALAVERPDSRRRS
jgi:hypothetical protein